MGKFKEFITLEEIAPPMFGSVVDRQAIQNRGQQPLPVMPVQSGKIDARISVIGYPKAYEGMLRACDQILSDENAKVQTVGDNGSPQAALPWGRLYFMSNKNNPERGFIEIEYEPQATKGMMGDLAYTAGWMTNNWTRPMRWAAEKTGMATNPEKLYLSQFVRELRRLANQQILYGLDEWDETTSYLGRNILIRPKHK